MNYRWIFRQHDDENTVHELASSLKIPKSLANVLVARGVRSINEAEIFFQPTLMEVHDPYLMRDMAQAVDRIIDSIKNGELIWIHGDYDVDGTASASMLLLFLREIGAKVDYYVPDRFDEGYGLSQKSVNLAISKGASIIITVDVGITSFDSLNYAKSHNLECLICDHHEPGDELPDVYAILDPVRQGCDYPFKHLSACGVTFKFIQALAIKIGKPELAFEYLDFVAVASAADMVPLVGENRVLVHFGLNKLNNCPRPGFKGLFDCTGMKLGQITTVNIVYSLAPLINAAGRMGDALRSVDMMTQKDELKAFNIAQQLEQENRRRRVFDEQTFEEAIPMAEEAIEKHDVRALVLHKPHWHAGIIGIVASRLVDRFHRPVVLLTSIDHVAKGSARSISSFDVHSALKKCNRFLLEFGGHKHAAGLSLAEANIPEFSIEFNKIASEKISIDMTVPEIMIDSELKFNELSPNFIDFLGSFAPFGFENYKPVFYTKNVTSQNGVKVTGKNIRFRAFQSNFAIDAIGYNLADKVKVITSGNPFEIVYNIEQMSYNGQNSPQIYIKDIR
ncbi:MAG: recJ [Ignavibacteria bacterium]|nr:recJ [Ignavibacteria bacterium]